MALSIVEQVYAGLDSMFRRGLLGSKDSRVKPKETEDEGLMAPSKRDDVEDIDYTEIPEEAQVARQVLDSHWMVALRNLNPDDIEVEDTKIA